MYGLLNTPGATENQPEIRTMPSENPGIAVFTDSCQYSVYLISQKQKTMTTANRQNPGSKPFRTGIVVLCICLSILFYWLIGFILNDISNQSGPELQVIQEQFSDARLVQEQNDLRLRLDTLNQNIDDLNKQQSITDTSINSYRDTMNQLLGFQKASIEKGIALSENMKTNLADTTNLYLNAQKKYQETQEKISNLSQERQAVQANQTKNASILDAQYVKANAHYEHLMEQFNLKLAFIKLGALIPLLLLSAWLLLRDKKSIYRPLVIAFGVATISKVVAVMNEYFPARYFKYILILLLILVIFGILRRMLRMMITPRPDWLLKQFKDSYNRLLCPGCQYPIRPGVLKFVDLLRGNKKQAGLQIADMDCNAPYACPGCGDQLLENCESCKKIRHSLLPYCEHCRFVKGDQTSLAHSGSSD